MKSLVAQIEDWLAEVKANRRLNAASTCFLVAHQLSRKTNSKEFNKTGRLTTWQSIPTLAAAIGKSQATVRRATGSLKAHGHILINTGRGPGKSNLYTLIEQERQAVAETGGQIPRTSERNYKANTDHQRAHFQNEMRSSTSPNALTGDAECAHQRAPNSSISNSIILPSTADTEPSGPRQRADALGPPRQTSLPPSQPPEPPDPSLATLEAEIREGLGERAEWLNGAKLVARDGTSATLSVWNAHQVDNIRRHCEAFILEITGTSRLEFVIEPPTPARRLQ
jgi:hypothetical protein